MNKQKSTRKFAYWFNCQLKEASFRKSRNFCPIWPYYAAITVYRSQWFWISRMWCCQEHCGVAPRENLSAGRKNIDLGYLPALFVQLAALRIFRLWSILGYKFNRISRSLASRPPLDAVRIPCLSGGSLWAQLGGIPSRFAYTMANKGEIPEVTPL